MKNFTLQIFDADRNLVSEEPWDGDDHIHMRSSYGECIRSYNMLIPKNGAAYCFRSDRKRLKSGHLPKLPHRKTLLDPDHYKSVYSFKYN